MLDYLEGKSVVLPMTRVEECAAKELEHCSIEVGADEIIDAATFIFMLLLTSTKLVML